MKLKETSEENVLLEKALDECKSIAEETKRQLTIVKTENDTIAVQLKAANDNISSNQVNAVRIDSLCEEQQLNITLLKSEIYKLNLQLSKKAEARAFTEQYETTKVETRAVE